MVACSKCGKFIDKTMKEEHDDEEHQKCRYCDHEMIDRDTHER